MTWRRYKLNMRNSLLSEEYFSIRCILTNDYGSSARENVVFYNLRGGMERIFDDIRTATAVHHANIVQVVKSCYKIKINSRESKSRFYGKRIRDASIYTSKKISLKFLFLSDIFLFPFVRQQIPVLT